MISDEQARLGVRRIKQVFAKHGYPDAARLIADSYLEGLVRDIGAILAVSCTPAEEDTRYAMMKEFICEVGLHGLRRDLQPTRQYPCNVMDPAFAYVAQSEGWWTNYMKGADLQLRNSAAAVLMKVNNAR